MNARRISLFLCAVGLALLLVTSAAIAVRADKTSVVHAQSSHYRLDWMQTGSGSGGQVSSPNYGANISVGQVLIGSSSSASYTALLGFWPGPVTQVNVYIPMVHRP